MQNLSRRLSLPLSNKWDVLVQYYLYFATSSWFTLGIWYVFFSKVASPEQIAIVHSLGFIVGLLFDIPTGFLADKIGRKRLLLIGIFLFSLGVGLFAFIDNIYQMIVFEIIVQLGLACISGTQEAVLHNSVSELTTRIENIESTYNAVYSKCRMLSNLALIISGVLGGYLYQYSDKLPWLLMSALCFIGLLLGVTIKDHQSLESKENISSPLLHLKEGFRIFRHKHTKYLLPSILVLGGVAFISDWGIFTPGVFSSAGFSPLYLSIFFSVTYTINIVANNYLPRLYKLLGKREGFTIYGVITGLVMVILAFSFSTKSFLIVALMGIFIVISSLLMGYSSSVVNSITTEKHRATTLSVASIAMKLPYLIVAPLIGLGFSKSKTWLTFLVFGVATTGTSMVLKISKVSTEKV